jgi:L-amino acid N-acyltransferase YncA
MRPGDWPAVARIYEAGIEGGDATFELAPPSWEQWCASHVEGLSLVARDRHGAVLGWAAVSPSSGRQVYRGVGEVSVYVDPVHSRRGVGSSLLRALVDACERAGFWTLEAGIFPENGPSVALHERLGFRLIGVRERIGRMADGRWRDVLLYERRSALVGGD